jgi:hypothetical protein
MCGLDIARSAFDARFVEEVPSVNIWRELLKDVKKIGPRRTIELIVGRLVDYWFDVKYGTDTLRIEELEDGLDFWNESKLDAAGYGPTRMRVFRKLVQVLDLPRDGAFVDFGSGKARVLLMASEHGFKKAVGVEFSPHLCEVARRNIATYQAKFRRDTEFEIHECDAAEYAIKDDENVFFFYHPFDLEVMSKVLHNIVASWKAAPRKIWLIDHNHLAYREQPYDEVIGGQGDVFERSSHHVFGGYESIIYVSKEPVEKMA